MSHIHSYGCLLRVDGKTVWPPKWGCVPGNPEVDLEQAERDYEEAMASYGIVRTREIPQKETGA